MSRSISDSACDKINLADEMFLSAVDNAHYLMSQWELITLVDSLGGLISEVKRELLNQDARRACEAPQTTERSDRVEDY